MFREKLIITATKTVGPALALVDATLHGRPEQVLRLRRFFGNRRLAESSALLMHRLMFTRGVPDEDLLSELSHVHFASWSAYHGLVMRGRDRLGLAAPALHAARRLVLLTLRHYAPYALYGEGSVEPPVMHVNPVTVSRGPSRTFGLAYATTLTFVYLAATAAHQPEDLLEAYRAVAAKELA